MNYSRLIDLTISRLEEVWAGKLILEAKRVQDQDDTNSEGKSWTPYGDSCHLLWMLGEMNAMLCDAGVNDEDGGPAKRDQKLNRWLGFVQGALWAHGMATIDQLRDDTRSSM